MLLRFTLSAAGALVLASTASAQIKAQVSPITSQVKDAGTYHLSTGTWSRGVSQTALAGPEIIYDNTCTVGFYVGLGDGDVILDSGRVPSLSSPSNLVSLTGTHDAYAVNGFSIAYCTPEPLVTSLDVSFTDCYSACDLAGGVLPPPLTTINLVNMPGGGAAGSLACWIVGLDLANTTAVFNLAGDCNGNYDNITSTDSFGWTWTQTIPTTVSDAGPILAGDPSAFFNASCGGIGGGTTFVGASALPGTGIGLLDQMQISNGPTPSGCYWFGGYNAISGNPMGGFYLQLDGDVGGGTGCIAGPGAAFCFGDGTGATCPCGAFGSAGQGCANSTGLGGAVLTGAGCTQLSNDTLTFDIVGVNGAKPGLLLRANNQIAVPVGDGIICVAGASQRSAVHFTDGTGATSFTEFAPGVSFGSLANVGAPTNFQYWYRDPSVNSCSGSEFNFTNAWSVDYLP